MKWSPVYVLALGLTFIWSCQQNPANTKQEQITKGENLPTLSVEEGLAMLQLNCYACHNPKTLSHDDMLAPPLVAVKWRYQKEYADRATFIQHMTEFVHTPAKENALMRGPVKRFGLMPKPALEKDKIKLIAAFIYDNTLEEPSWFAEHFAEQHGEEWKQ